MLRRVAIDLEFREGYENDDGVDDGTTPTIDLISIALVDVDATASTYYAVSAQLDVAAMLGRDFLVKNVYPHMPFLPGRPAVLDLRHPDVKPRAQIRNEVIDFILGPVGPSDRVQIWADCGGYDYVATHWLWGGIRGCPPQMPHRFHDIGQYAEMIGVPEGDLPKQPDIEQHHALRDAAHTATCLRYLDGRAPAPVLRNMGVAPLRWSGHGH